MKIISHILGAHIVPTFFFGNSSILKVVGTESGSKSWISKFSRKFRTSLIFFYGRGGERKKKKFILIFLFIFVIIINEFLYS